MGFLDKLFGGGRGRREPERDGPWPREPAQRRTPPSGDRPRALESDDDRAVARYTYLLRTARPEQLEAVHAEAFAQLTPDQRRQVLDRLAGDLPPEEAPRSDDPRDMARAATRAEMRNPGYLRGAWTSPGTGTGMGMGGMLMGSLFGSIAGVVIGSAIADAMFDDYDGSPEALEAGDSASDVHDDAGGGWDDLAGDGGFDDGGASADAGFDDAGGFGGDFGGDFGGGDF